MKRRLQTWGLALILGLALSAVFDVEHPLDVTQRSAVAQIVSPPKQ